MSHEEQARFAAKRRQGMTAEKRDEQIRNFNAADDVFTTCQKCMKVVGARFDGKWVIAEHDCADSERT